jgi:transcription elongation factor Elf1
MSKYSFNFAVDMLKIGTILFLFFIFSCANDEGKKLAQKYCKCIMDAKGDIYGVGECEDEFKDEIKALEKKPRVYSDFMDEIENCQ